MGQLNQLILKPNQQKYRKYRKSKSLPSSQTTTMKALVKRTTTTTTMNRTIRNERRKIQTCTQVRLLIKFYFSLSLEHPFLRMNRSEKRGQIYEYMSRDGLKGTWTFKL